MREGIRSILILTGVLLTILVYLSVFYLIKWNVISLDNLFGLNNIVTMVLLFLVATFVTNMAARGISIPIKKLEKNMKNVISGKIDLKGLKNSSSILEVSELTDTYTSMMEMIRKNNFDLNSQQSKTEIILEHMADGVIGFSTAKDVIHLNKSAIELLDIDSSCDSYEKIATKLAIDIKFEQIIYLPNYRSIEQKLSINDNILNLVFVPFFNNNSVPMGILLIVQNITESTRLDNMRKEFVANVSHEFKTPLTSIKGYSETMMREDLTAKEISEFARVINQEASRMDRLVADLLQLSKFDYSRASMKRTNFSLSDLAKLVAEKMKYSSEQKEHKLICDIKNPTKICADKDSIEQVLLNIVSNSIKYTPDGGTIKIEVANDGNNAYVRITDDGMGIPEKELQRIFERFYRVDKARSRQMGGTGLGLSIVKEIIDSVGGSIDMKSQVDFGTETIITLPVLVK